MRGSGGWSAWKGRRCLEPRSPGRGGNWKQISLAVCMKLLPVGAEPDCHGAAPAIIRHTFDQTAHGLDEIRGGARPPLGAKRLEMLPHVLAAGLSREALQLFEHRRFDHGSRQRLPETGTADNQWTETVCHSKRLPPQVMC